MTINKNLCFSNVLKNYNTGIVKIISNKVMDSIDPGKLKFKNTLKNSIPLIFIVVKGKKSDEPCEYVVCNFKIFITNDFKKIALSLSDIDTFLHPSYLKPYTHIGAKFDIKNRDILYSIEESFLLDVAHKLISDTVEISDVSLITDYGFDNIRELIKYPYFKNLNMFKVIANIKMENNYISLYENHDKCAIIHKNIIYTYDNNFSNLLNAFSDEYRIKYIDKRR